MTLLFRYLFRRFLGMYITLAILMGGLIWLAQSLRYVDLIINNNLTIGGFFSLTLYLFPDLFVLITPIAFAVCLLFVYHRMMISHELSAFRSIGMSNFLISMPSLTLGAGLFILLVTLNAWFVPSSFQKFGEQQHLLQNAFSGMLLREGNFNTAKYFTVYVKEHNKDGQVKNVFIYQAPKPNGNGHAYTTLAESGHVYTQNDRLFVLLKKGQRQDYDPKTKAISVLSFDEFLYDLTNELSSKRAKIEKPAEKKLFELLFPDDSVLEDMRQKFKVEAHQRMLLPYLCVVDALFISAILLFGEVGRRYSRKKMLCAALGFFIIHISVFACINSGLRSESGLMKGYLFVFFLTILSSLYLSKDWILLRFPNFYLRLMSCFSFFQVLMRRKKC